MFKTVKFVRRLDDAAKYELHALKKLIEYVTHRKIQAVCGRHFNPKYGVIVWPDVFKSKKAFNRLTELTASVPLPKELSELDNPARHLFPRGAQDNPLIRRTELLLGPIVCNDPTLKNQLLFEYIQERARRAREASLANTYSPLASLSVSDIRDPLLDAFNKDSGCITVFRRVFNSQTTLLRTRPWLLPPFNVVESYFDYVPHWLQFLWGVWKLAYYPPIPRPELGIEFLRNGLIGINWRVFLASGHRPHILPAPVTLHRIKAYQGLGPLTPDSVVSKLEKERNCFTPFRKGILKRDFTPFADRPDMPYYRYNYPADSEYTFLCREMRTPFNIIPATADCDASCDLVTIIDPITLANNSKLFEGAYYYYKERKKQRINMLETTPSLQHLNATPRTTRFFCFPFNPVNYLSTPEANLLFDRCPRPENVYAIRRKGELCFTHPPHMRKKPKDLVKNEAEAWRRVMDLLNHQDSFYSNDGRVTTVSASEHFQRMNDAKKAEFVFETYRKTWSDLTKRNQIRYTHLFNDDWKKENPHVPILERYRMLCEGIRQARVPISAIVKEATILFPGESEPRKTQFLTSRVIDCVHALAEGSFHRVSEEDASLEFLSAALPPVPYLLAWSRFCKDIQAKQSQLTKSDYVGHSSVDLYSKSPSSRKKRIRRTPWTPEEDLIFFMRYEYHGPKSKKNLTPDDWDDILSHLNNKTHVSCNQRVGLVNKTIKPFLSPSRYEDICVGNVTGRHSAVLRLIYVYGFVKYLRRTGRPEHTRYPGVHHILNLRVKRLNEIGLPQRYTDNTFFSRFDMLSR